MALGLDGTPQYTEQTSGGYNSIVVTGISTTYGHGFIFMSTINNFAGPQSVSSITDTAGLSWSKLAGSANAGSNTTSEVWYAQVGSSALSSDSVTVNYTGISSYGIVYCWVVSNAGAVCSLDTGTITVAAANVIASLSGSVMTVIAVNTGTLAVGQYLTNGEIPTGTYISSFGTGSGGTGTYNLSGSVTTGVGQTVGAMASYITQTNNAFAMQMFRTNTTSNPTTSTPWTNIIGSLANSYEATGYQTVAASGTTVYGVANVINDVSWSVVWAVAGSGGGGGTIHDKMSLIGVS